MRPQRLCVLAQHIAESRPGKGDHETAKFVRSLQEAAHGMFGTDYSEKLACISASFRFEIWHAP